MVTIDEFMKILPYFGYGFLSLKIWELITPTKEKKATEIILEILFYGVLYNKIMIYFKDAYIVIRGQNFNLEYFIAIVLIILTPIILNKILNCSFIRNKIVKTTSPTSWDYFFSKREKCMVIVYLKDASNPIIGKFEYDSFASSFPNKTDLYLEKAYTLNPENGNAEEKEKSKGLYIPFDSIKYIEFLTY